MHLSRNVEIKARLRDPETMIERVVAIADSGPVELNQEDTYFKFPGALLKLGLAGAAKSATSKRRRGTGQ